MRGPSSLGLQSIQLGGHSTGIQVAISVCADRDFSRVLLVKRNDNGRKTVAQRQRASVCDSAPGAIIASIVSLAEALGMETTAEGVETLEQAEYLVEQGCDVLQGYAFARPMPVQQFVELQASH